MQLYGRSGYELVDKFLSSHNEKTFLVRTLLYGECNEEWREFMRVLPFQMPDVVANIL